MLSEQIIEFLREYIYNDYLLLFVVSAIPLIEMRGAVLLAASMGGNAIVKSLICWAGSSVVCPLIILTFRPIVDKLKATKAFSGLAVRVDGIVRKRADKNLKVQETGRKAAKRKYLLLFAFVAIPLPLTGVWSGSAISCFMEGGYFKKTASVVLGNLVATMLMTVIASLAKEYVNLLLIVFLLVVAFCVLLTVYKLVRTKPQQ